MEERFGRSCKENDGKEVTRCYDNNSYVRNEKESWRYKEKNVETNGASIMLKAMRTRRTKA